MAKKISQLGLAGDVTVNDLFQVVDKEDTTMAPTGTNKRITAQTLGNFLPVTATGSSASRTLKDRFADTVSVKDFGAVGDGVTDDTAAIQAALNFATNGGIVFCPKGNYYIASDLLVKHGTTLQGAFSAVGEQVINNQDPTRANCSFFVNPTATIKVDNGAAVRGFVVINASLKSFFSSAKTPSSVITAIASFSGTGFTVIGSDAGIFDCLIGGFEYGIITKSGSNIERVKLERLLIDSTNGVLVNFSADICRFYGVHCWPWVGSRNTKQATWTRSGTTVTVTSSSSTHNLSNGLNVWMLNSVGDTGVNNFYAQITVINSTQFTYQTSATGATTTGTIQFAAPARRQGAAFRISRGDGLTLMSCFSYGWDIGFDLNGPYGQILDSCAADGMSLDVGQVGFNISSNATYGSATSVHMSTCMSSGVSFGFFCNATSARASLNNCEFHGNDVHIQSDLHSVLNITGSIFNDHPAYLSRKKSIILNNTVGRTSIVGNTFNSGTSGVIVTTSASRPLTNNSNNVYANNTVDTEGSTWSVGGTGGVNGSVNQTFYASTTGGTGHIQNFCYSSGSLGSPSVTGSGAQPYKLNVKTYDGSSYGTLSTFYAKTESAPSTGSTPGQFIFATTPDGLATSIDRVTINSSGNLIPLTDNSYSLGVTGARWQAIWAANGVIQTSDERTKTDIETSQLGLDFINDLEPVSYKFSVGGNKVIRQVYRDAEGNEVAQDAEGATPSEILTEVIEGQRTHYGLLAQQVKAVLPEGADFGGWILTDKDDPESQQGLRYEEFISPMIKAIQELSAKVALLESK